MTKTFRPGEGYTKQEWDEVSDNPKWTKEELARARPFAEVFPDLADTIRRGRGSQKAPTKVAVNIRLDRDLVDRLRAGGRGWQSRANALLRKALGP